MLPKDERRFEIHILNFLFFVALYSILSWLLFLFTSGGWSLVLYYTLGAPFYPIFVVIASIVEIFRCIIGRSQYIKVDKRFLALLLLTQCIYILFNFGDCGDSGGAYTFIEKLIRGSEYFCTQNNNSFIVPYSMALLPMAYVITLFLFIFNCPSSGER